MKVLTALIGFIAGIMLAQHFHQIDWANYTSSTVQHCTKGARGN